MNRFQKKILGLILIFLGLSFAIVTGYNHGDTISPIKLIFVTIGFLIAFIGLYLAMFYDRAGNHHERY